MRASFAVAMVVWLACCRQTPPEELPPSDATTARSSSDHGLAAVGAAASSPSAVSAGPAFDGRCVLPTPTAPAPPVAAGPAPGCPPDPESHLSQLPTVRVGFADAPSAVVDAELVRSSHDTSRGLMYRKSMDENRGMLFDLGMREDHKFWMHNTCIPLDLLFIDFDGLLVGIVENAPTLNDDTRSVGCPSRWVLEVNAGWARRHGVRAGQRVELPAAAVGAGNGG